MISHSISTNDIHEELAAIASDMYEIVYGVERGCYSPQSMKERSVS